MFENKNINGIYATRFIMSWVREGGKLHYKKDYDDFNNWLISTGLNEEDAYYIRTLAENGKFELENSARKFLSELEK